MANCQSLDKSPAIDSPDNKPELREEMNEYYLVTQSTSYPGSTKEQPLLFSWLIDGVSRRRH
jgi:hypothetical protein